MANQNNINIFLEKGHPQIALFQKYILAGMAAYAVKEYFYVPAPDRSRDDK